MSKCIKEYKFLQKVISIGMVCLFMINTTWAYPFKSFNPDKLAAISAFQTSWKAAVPEREVRNVTEMTEAEIFSFIPRKYAEVKKHSRAVWQHARVIALACGIEEDSDLMRKLRIFCLIHDVGNALGYRPDDETSYSVQQLARQHGIAYLGVEPADLFRKFKDARVALSASQIQFLHEADHGVHSIRLLEAGGVIIPDDIRTLVAKHLHNPTDDELAEWGFTDEQKRLWLLFTLGDICDCGNSYYRQMEGSSKYNHRFNTHAITLAFCEQKFSSDKTHPRKYVRETLFAGGKNILEILRDLEEDKAFLEGIEYSRTPKVIADIDSSNGSIEQLEDVADDILLFPRDGVVAKCKVVIEQLKTAYDNNNAPVRQAKLRAFVYVLNDRYETLKEGYDLPGELSFTVAAMKKWAQDVVLQALEGDVSWSQLNPPPIVTASNEEMTFLRNSKARDKLDYFTLMKYAIFNDFDINVQRVIGNRVLLRETVRDDGEGGYEVEEDWMEMDKITWLTAEQVTEFADKLDRFNNLGFPQLMTSRREAVEKCLTEAFHDFRANMIISAIYLEEDKVDEKRFETHRIRPVETVLEPDNEKARDHFDRAFAHQDIGIWSLLDYSLELAMNEILYDRIEQEIKERGLNISVKRYINNLLHPDNIYNYRQRVPAGLKKKMITMESGVRTEMTSAAGNDHVNLSIQLGADSTNNTMEIMNQETGEYELPVKTSVRLTHSPTVRLYALTDEYEGEVEITSLGDIYDLNQDRRFAIHKACLVAMGIFPNHFASPGFKYTLKEILELFTGEKNRGIELTIEVKGVPPQSGLGTSSAVATNTLAALAKLTGLARTDNELPEIDEIIKFYLARTLSVEQRLGSLGGWDDAASMLPGIKILHTEPGEFLPGYRRINPGAQNEMQKLVKIVRGGLKRAAVSGAAWQFTGLYALRSEPIVRARIRARQIVKEQISLIRQGRIADLAERIEEETKLWQVIAPEAYNEYFRKIKCLINERLGEGAVIFGCCGATFGAGNKAIVMPDAIVPDGQPNAGSKVLDVFDETFIEIANRIQSEMKTDSKYSKYEFSDIPAFVYDYRIADTAMKMDIGNIPQARRTMLQAALVCKIVERDIRKAGAVRLVDLEQIREWQESVRKAVRGCKIEKNGSEIKIYLPEDRGVVLYCDSIPPYPDVDVVQVIPGVYLQVVTEGDRFDQFLHKQDKLPDHETSVDKDRFGWQDVIDCIDTMVKHNDTQGLKKLQQAIHACDEYAKADKSREIPGEYMIKHPEEYIDRELSIIEKMYAKTWTEHARRLRDHFDKPWVGEGAPRISHFILHDYINFLARLITGYYDSQTGGKDIYASVNNGLIQGGVGLLLKNLDDEGRREQADQEMQKADVLDFVRAILFGNQECDIFHAGKRETLTMGRDDSAAFADWLLSLGKGSVVDFFVDNVGMELSTDLQLFDYLLDNKIVGKIRVHIKNGPYSISDAFGADKDKNTPHINDTLEAFREKARQMQETNAKDAKRLRTIADRIEKAINEGEILLTIDRFSFESDYTVLQEELNEYLSGSDGVVFIGDHQRRKIFGNRRWAHTSSRAIVDDRLGYINAPVTSISVVKSDIKHGAPYNAPTDGTVGLVLFKEGNPDATKKFENGRALGIRLAADEVSKYVEENRPVFFVPQELLDSRRCEDIAVNYPGVEFKPFNQYEMEDFGAKLEAYRERKKVVITIGSQFDDVKNIYKNYGDIIPINLSKDNVSGVIAQRYGNTERKLLEKTVLAIGLLAIALPKEDYEGTCKHVALRSLLSLVLPDEADVDLYISNLVDSTSGADGRLSYLINAQLRPIVQYNYEQLKHIVEVFIYA